MQAARGLLVAGTSSDAGKSVITAGICRWLYRQGIKVAPFKAQNMSNNSVVVMDAPSPDGNGFTTGEIGRAQALQATACGLEPSVLFNPILLKPGSDYTSQVVALGRVMGEVNAVNYPAMQHQVHRIAYDALDKLRAKFDVVVCEGAGSLAEINLRRSDYVNMGLARKVNWPVVIVGDIDRGGVFAALYGSVALLSPEDQRLIAGFIINKFRGEASLLTPGIQKLEELTGRSVLGKLPWQLDLWLDSEDYVAHGALLGNPATALGDQSLRVAVVRLPHISNATDMDPLAAEPGVQVQFTANPKDLEAADLIVIPGSKSTVSDLQWLQTVGLDLAIKRHADSGRPLLGICGGFQMLAGHIEDEVESKQGGVEGLNLLPTEIEFSTEKKLGWSQGTAFGSIPVRGYEIHHGYVSKLSDDSEPLIVAADGKPEGVRAGNLFGTHWHGIFESDQFRRAFLTETARIAKRTGFEVAPNTDFTQTREHMLDLLGDLIENNLHTGQLLEIIWQGAPVDLPIIQPQKI